MRTYILLLVLISLLGPIACSCAQAGFENFVTCSSDRLMDGSKELRFISYNIPNLHYVEDHMPFEESNSWRLPDEFEITDALTAISQAGGGVARIYTLSVRRNGDDPAIPRHVLGPGRFNEEAFIALDKVLQIANGTGVRIIIPFVDNWKWWGGIEQYAAFRGKPKEAFWTDPQVIDDFKKTIEFVVNRTNTLTGVRYVDDKAILAWETGNELESPVEWTHQIAAHIKSLDRNHLIIDGFHSSILRDESINEPLVDIVTTHHYPKNADEMINQVRANAARTRGKKPYFVGEFGFTETPGVREFLDMVIEEGVSGALIWSLRFRSRDGGFYWHSEPFGGDRYKAYHWPGFNSGASYDEINLMTLMREMAFRIRGLPPAPLEIPKPPVMLAVSDASAISWRGSAGAASYEVERSSRPDGPWMVVGREISDATWPYRPLFNDTSAQIGQQYFYRTIARNIAGQSEPSNVVGPFRPAQLTLVDEMRDFSFMESHEDLSIDVKQTRKAKEDMNRVEGDSGASIVYKLPASIVSCRIFSFFPAEVSPFRCSLSADGRSFTPVAAQRRDYYKGGGEYGYWKPVLFHLQNVKTDVDFLKIEFTTKAQISRTEIRYGESPPMTAKDIETLIEEIRRDLDDNILGFWLKHSIDHEHGGFVGRMSNSNVVQKNAPKGLILNARLLWTYSAAWRFDKKPEYLKTAQRAYDYLMKYFWDDEHGGAFWLLDAEGTPIDTSKELYGQAFVVYSLCEYYRATGTRAALDEAVQLFDLIEKNCHDPVNNGYYETFTRDWSRAEKARLATGDIAEQKTMNTHLHLLEAYTGLYRVHRDRRVQDRLRELIELFRNHIVDPDTYHFKLFFDDKWQSTKDVVSYGHDIEGSWLLCEAADVLGDEKLIREIRPLAVNMARAVYERGVDVDGGLLYESEEGRITNESKQWWPQAETIVGFINAYQVGRQDRFLEAARRCWEFTRDNIVDHENGEWLWGAPMGKPVDPDAMKISEWKAPYHNGRACIEAIERLERIRG